MWLAVGMKTLFFNAATWESVFTIVGTMKMLEYDVPQSSVCYYGAEKPYTS